MGGQQSARRISIENDEPNNVIKVSEKVVERLKGSVDGAETPNPPRSTSSSNTVHIQPRKVHSSTDGREIVSVTSLDIQKKYEDEIKANNEYWENRIKNLQATHEKINETWDREYKRAVQEVETIFPKAPAKDKKLPCSDQKSVVLKCYKQNSGQPLLCANEVQAFSDCMNNASGNSKKN